MGDIKRIAILVEEGFEDSELIEPIRAMKSIDMRVLIVGSGSAEIYTGKSRKTPITVDTTAEKVKAEDIIGIIVPGGYAPDRMRMHQPMIDLVKEAHDLGKIIAAICHGPQLLISAEILRGRCVTSWPSIALDLRNAGAKWIDAPVVQDGNIITSRKPADLPKFIKTIIDAIQD
ncbi:type 1 glutamine amidotransferase domain-containing protein [Chloroflexota bacterium]